MVEICRRLDGIPLAIELAASRMASMTAGEVRDRLDDRFRLLVGSRRGLERHQTLRHAVAWSYDLLDDAEKTVLERCSVFAGGFDLQSCLRGSRIRRLDDYAILDLLDALVRKSLLVADRSSGRTRFSMLETIRQFAEEQLVARGAATRSGPPMPATSPGAKPTSWPCGTAPASVRPTTGSPPNWPICAPRFGGPPTMAISMSPPPSPAYAGFLGLGSETLEPIAWAEELIEPARAVDHPRLAFLYVVASLCYMTGRIEAASATATPARSFSAGSRDALPYGFDGMLGAVYLVIGQPERCGRVVPRPARTPPRHPRPHPGMPGFRLAWPVPVRRRWLPRTVSSRLPRQRATRSCSRSRSVPTASPSATRIPSARLTPCGRGLVIAQDSGNRAIESLLANRWPPRGRTRRHRWPRSITSRWRSATTTTRATPDDPRPAGCPRRSFRPARTPRIGGHHRRFRAQSPHRSGDPRTHHRDHPPARCPRRPDLRIARPQGRDDDHRRHGDLRIRPNRPGPSRTERCLGIDDIRGSRKSIAIPA